MIFRGIGRVHMVGIGGAGMSGIAEVLASLGFTVTGSDGQLWELVVGWRAFPHVFELQQPKRREHIEAIAEAFRPYFEARDWETVENPTP